MLSVWDEQLPKGREVVLRQSMVKFQSEHKALEIVGYSKRLPLYLNRQIILILGCLGVPAKSFEQLQGRLLEGLNRSMEGDGAEAALNLLYTSGFGGSDNRLKSLAPMVDAAKLFRAGLTCANCEHLYDIMLAFRKRTLGELVSRTRIPLSVDMGMCAVGILDEAGVLGAGCIFLQYTSPESGDLKVVKGPVAVGRSPCLHPGDIQPLRAVYHPALSHLVDVVVFPRVGRRPIPSMLAGGDLDGDLFAVIWEPSLLPTRPGYPAMDYVAPPPAVLDRDVRMDDIHDFFVSYIRNDRLGQIANAHGVWADKLKDGIRSPECLMLAALHSTAVDFAKSGVPAEFPRDLMTRNEVRRPPPPPDTRCAPVCAPCRCAGTDLALLLCCALPPPPPPPSPPPRRRSTDGAVSGLYGKERQSLVQVDECARQTVPCMHWRDDGSEGRQVVQGHWQLQACGRHCLLRPVRRRGA
jgi:RNA-dependent RNA polymerase